MLGLRLGVMNSGVGEEDDCVGCGGWWMVDAGVVFSTPPGYNVPQQVLQDDVVARHGVAPPLRHARICLGPSVWSCNAFIVFYGIHLLQLHLTDMLQVIGGYGDKGDYEDEEGKKKGATYYFCDEDCTQSRRLFRFYTSWIRNLDFVMLSEAMGIGLVLVRRKDWFQKRATMEFQLY